MQPNRVKTSFFILSDTHAEKGLQIPTVPVDVAIHCGDITDGSKIGEFHTSLDLLRRINAPLKLVIAGNHDFTLDDSAFRTKLLASEKENNIVFLDDGIHTSTLQNGAKLTVYASPFTPSPDADSSWGFQYQRGEQHEFNITNDVGVVITHGPPNGVLDRTASGQRLGCEQLFAAVAKARPKIHCFGHVHNGWGAKLVAWRDTPSETPTHFSDIDNGKSVLLDSLATILPGKWDTEDMAREKTSRLQDMRLTGYLRTSHCLGDEHPIAPNKTLFVNAAVQATERGTQFPWVVDIDLPAAT
ncbi:Metallo-dependent phosphatase-like protein [Triangularia verruculosa]|uniref:Metallo-dependent phosphatase-like protein n=1 Tax=Triangularia verruculosa TaxID=2587418 RepID=A0AAN6X9E3_9PEZI|nr:Metallo-dependent phosphatase-like protein [Triangularia verruculosa]